MHRLFALLLALSLFPCLPASADDDNGLLAVNVGKADALLLFSGADVYLIDSGTAESWPLLARALRANRVDHLSGVILTHTHKDHAGGLWALAQSGVAVDHWYASAMYAETSKKKHPAVLAAELRGREVEWLQGGDTLPLDGGRLTVLGPIAQDEVENNNSLVLLAEVGGCSLLLTGDMEFPEEQSLMDAGLIGAVDVLKVGNHGNPDATLDSFAALTRPSIAVISTDSAVDTNTPHKRVLKALKAAGAQVAMTENAGQGVWVSCAGGQAKAYLIGWPELPAVPQGVRLADKDAASGTIRVVNDSGAAVDISGWSMYSDKGNETFVFPQGAVIPAGSSVTVADQSAKGSADFIWPEEKVWNKKKADLTSLYDSWGRLISQLD